MVKTQLGLGILAIPASFDALGLIPGVILLCFMASLTTWTGYVVGEFKLRHRAVYSISDACELMFGPIGREFFYVAYVTCMLPSVNVSSSR